MSNAIAITLDKQARASYDARTRAEDARELGTSGQSVAEYRSTVARLAAIAPAAVKIH